MEHIVIYMKAKCKPIDETKHNEKPGFRTGYMLFILSIREGISYFPFIIIPISME